MIDPQTPQRRRSWIETVVVFVLWGTDGLDRGKTIPQFGLNTMLLVVSALRVWLAQYEMKRAADTKFAVHMSAAERGTPSELPANWNRPTRIAGGFNFIAVCVAAYYYRPRGLRGIWYGVGIAAIGVVLSIAIDAALPPRWL